MSRLKETPGPTGIVAMVLAGAFDLVPPRDAIRVDELERQLAELLYENRGRNSLIRDNYHFVTAGAFPYSREVHDSLETLHEVGILAYTTGEPGTNVHGRVVNFASVSFAERKITEVQYRFLRNLGRKLKIN